MVFLDVGHITPEILYDLQEFLRINMITPVLKGVDVTDHGFFGNDNGSQKSPASHYSGCFTVEYAKRIEGWLKENGVELKSS